MWRLKQLKDENRKLERQVAGPSLDEVMLRDVFGLPDILRLTKQETIMCFGICRGCRFDCLWPRADNSISRLDV